MIPEDYHALYDRGVQVTRTAPATRRGDADDRAGAAVRGRTGPGH
jgi:hypothetical protein